MTQVTKQFKATGTTCNSCEKIISKAANDIDGVTSVEFNFATETGSVTYDNTKTSLVAIFQKIGEKGYSCSCLEDTIVQTIPEELNESLPLKSEDSCSSKKKSNDCCKEQKNSSSWGWVFGLLGLLIIAFYSYTMVGSNVAIPALTQNMGLGLIFIVGLLTGFHCIGMCGGFIVGYTAKNAAEGKTDHWSHVLYGTGKTLSYTFFGALFGLVGLFIAFTPTLRGWIGILSGLFLIFYGIRMLNLIPAFRKVNLAPHFLTRWTSSQKKNTGPLGIGLLNGMMIACGPLQAMYILAAGTGSPLEGAKMLFVFGLGTLPILLGFGYVASFMSSKLTHTILKASGMIVIILGIIMFNRGLALTGNGISLFSSVSGAEQSDGVQIVRMDVTKYGYEPNSFVVKKGIPIQWIITAKELTNCNSQILLADYNLDIKLKEGEQIVEFTPTKEGSVQFSCWMGMLRGSFEVQGEGNKKVSQQQQSITRASIAQLNGNSQTIRMDVLRSGYEPNTFVLKKDVPVRWIINGKELAGCNQGIKIPDYNMRINLKPGEQVVEFTPDKVGTVQWSCLMGMMQGQFIVSQDGSDTAAIQNQIAQAPLPKGGACGGGGGCGCGGS